MVTFIRDLSRAPSAPHELGASRQYWAAIGQVTRTPWLRIDLFNGCFLESICSSQPDDLVRQLWTTRATRVQRIALLLPKRTEASILWTSIPVETVWRDKAGYDTQIHFDDFEGWSWRSSGSRQRVPLQSKRELLLTIPAGKSA